MSIKDNELKKRFGKEVYKFLERVLPKGIGLEYAKNELNAGEFKNAQNKLKEVLTKNFNQYARRADISQLLSNFNQLLY